MDKVEIRRKRIINIVYIAIVIAVFYLLFKYCLGFFFPFIYAFFIALLVQKPSHFLAGKTKIKNGAWSAILVILLYLLTFFLIYIISVDSFNRTRDFIEFIKDKISDFPTLVENVKNKLIDASSFLPDGIEEKFNSSLETLFDSVRDRSIYEIAQSAIDKAGVNTEFSVGSLIGPIGSIISTFKDVPTVLFSIFTAILSSCFMAKDYCKIVDFIKRQMSSENYDKLVRGKAIVIRSLKNLIRSYALIILITATEVATGLFIMKCLKIYQGGNILRFAIIISFFDILPVIGTSTFIIPWAIYSLITGKIAFGIGLIILNVFIDSVRQVIEPKIIGNLVGLSAFVTFASMYIGSQIFGFLGIFIMPIIVIIVKLLNEEGIIHIWNPIEDDKPQKKERKTVKDRLHKLKRKSN